MIAQATLPAFPSHPSHVCRACGRELSNPASIAAGIGPVCAARYRRLAQTDPDSLDPDDLIDAGNVLPFDPQTGDIVCFRNDSGLYTNVPRRIVRHSPSGYEWGYGGSGPADFALNILLLFTDQHTADRLYQEFKREFVAALPEWGGTIRGADIRAWLEARRQEGTA